MAIQGGPLAAAVANYTVVTSEYEMGPNYGAELDWRPPTHPEFSFRSGRQTNLRHKSECLKGETNRAGEHLCDITPTTRGYPSAVNLTVYGSVQV